MLLGETSFRPKDNALPWRICYSPLLNIRGLQPGKQRAMSCRTLRERSLHAHRIRYILPQLLTLTLLLFIDFVVFLLCTFCTDRKYQRARHTGKIFTNVLCSGHICVPSVGRLFVTPGFRLFSGCCGTRSTRIFGIIYIRITLKQSSHNGLKTTGLALDFSTVPSLGHYQC